MPSLLDRLLRPERTPPPPVQVDLAHVLLVGTGVWVAGLVVCAVLGWTGATDWVPTVVCATGVVIGLGALAWARRRRPQPGTAPER
ncbi:DUF2530 domain-containing protein [Cellulomonas sp. H30R-01]|uniref:DUF2530 domain-containing protein n=1 Tax=Cellulomonas algicola TaxID=2071633 RepID=A0A401UZ41_9CELL|nr:MULTISPECIES: DUF2530 domain-containing protein [Cellulomonas]QHT56895.1 DUF2530 domain-containing protein [Cellulomonas sp. H30R-01]GCD19875.1 hypothetical protein CTKZ_14370 [Cellulomonas algicola]